VANWGSTGLVPTEQLGSPWRPNTPHPELHHVPSTYKDCCMARGSQGDFVPSSRHWREFNPLRL